MRRASGIGLLWLGRGLVLAAPYVVVCALFLPAGIQFLNPVACPDGLELDNARFTGEDRPDNAKLEVVCNSPEGSTSAGQEITLITVGLLAAGGLALYASSSLRRHRRQLPGTTSTT